MTSAAHPDRIALAHKIATTLWDEGCRGAEGITIIALALGIYLDAQEGAHREFKPLIEVVCRESQDVFDRLQAGRRSRGHA